MTTIMQKEWLKSQSSEKKDVNHVHRVAQTGLKIARRLNLFQDDVETLYQAALIHDLEYVAVFGHLLNLNQAADTVRYKDEWYDGRGNEGLQRGAIPVLSRVLAIADYYDELRMKGISKDKALNALQRLSGSRFDPMMIPIAIRALEEKQ